MASNLKIWLASYIRNLRLDHDMKNDHFGFLSIRLLMLNPIAYGILLLSQLRGWDIYPTSQKKMLKLFDWFEIWYT